MLIYILGPASAILAAIARLWLLQHDVPAGDFLARAFGPVVAQHPLGIIADELAVRGQHVLLIA